MKILFSAVVAYIISGISQVANDICCDPIKRPFWVIRGPTFSKALLVAATWPYRPFLEIYYRQPRNPENLTGRPRVARSIAFGAFAVTIQWSALTFLMWCCIALAIWLFDNFWLQTLSVLILIVPALLYGVPLMMILTAPLQIALARLLGLAFARAKQAEPDIEIGTPKYERESSYGYEETERPTLAAPSDEPFSDESYFDELLEKVEVHSSLDDLPLSQTDDVKGENLTAEDVAEMLDLTVDELREYLKKEKIR